MISLTDIWNGNIDLDKILGDNNIKIDIDPIMKKILVSQYLVNDMIEEDKNIVNNINFTNIVLLFREYVNFDMITSSENRTFNNKRDDSLFVMTYGGNFVYKKLEIDDLSEELNCRNVIKADYNEQTLINIYKALSPSIEWMEKSIKYQFYLPPAHKKIIENYVSYEYTHINRSLREGSSNTKLNDIIYNCHPLDKDIVVYRIINNDDFISEEFIHKGYISTTILANKIFEIAASKSRKYVMEITVPKGTHCLWIPRDEYEIILPHLTKLKLNYTSNCIDENIKIYNLSVI